MNTPLIERELSYEEERGKPMPSTNHGIIQANLIVEFSRHREYRVISELTLLIEDERYTPDLSIYPRQPIDLKHDTGPRTDPPLLAVEIFSPQQSSQDVMDKTDAYFRFGVKSCWIVAPPMRAIRILTSDGHEETITSGTVTDPVTGLTAEIDAVFS